MATLEQAAKLGIITVTEQADGWHVVGARGDLLLEDELQQMGAYWREVDSVYIIPLSTGEIANRAKALKRRSVAAAAALAARQKLAAKQGATLFDNQRARMQRKITRELKDVYKLAMLEHGAEIERLKSLQNAIDPEQDPAEYFKLLHRRGELEQVYDELARGLANAGESAAALMSGQLQEAHTIGRNLAAWQVDNMAGMQVSRMVAHDSAALALSAATSYHGKYDLKAWQGVADRRKCRDTIRKAVSRGLLTGEHPTKIAKRIEGLFTGNEPLSPYARAVRIARTETARVMTEGTQEYISSLNVDGIKTRKRWDATLDGATRDSHREVDGEIVDDGEKFSNGLMRPGDGGAAESINCRCCLTPVLDGFEPDSPVRRDNATGELIPYRTYKQWAEENGAVVEAEPQEKNHGAPKLLMQPKRPRKSDYSSEKELEAARTAYRQKRDEYDKRVNEVVSYHINKQKRYSSPEAVEKWAADSGIKLQRGLLDVIDIRVMDDIISVHNEMKKQFPQVFEKINYRIGLLDGSDNSFMDASGGLNLNAKIFDNYENVLREAIGNTTDGFTVYGDGTFKTKVRHEFGHNLDSVIQDRFTGKDGTISDHNGLKMYRSELDELAQKYGSEYATTNSAEAFAEGLAEYVSNPNSEFGKAFGKFLNKWLE